MLQRETQHGDRKSFYLLHAFIGMVAVSPKAALFVQSVKGWGIIGHRS